MSDGGTCPKCGKPLEAVCPECGHPVDVFSRVVGYLRPVSLWNDGKQQEFLDRREYTQWDGGHLEFKSDYTRGK